MNSVCEKCRDAFSGSPYRIYEKHVAVLVCEACLRRSLCDAAYASKPTDRLNEQSRLRKRLLPEQDAS